MKKHLKRLAAPKSWTIKRKNLRFVTKPNPGRHPLAMCIPLNILIRDILGYANSFREVKKILRYNNILIDGVKKTEPSFPVGLFDTIQLSEIKKCFRLVINKKGKLVPIEINNNEVNLKPCKIINKSMVRGKTQLNLYDGRNILVDGKSEYKTGDTVIIKLPEQDIKEHLKLENGCSVFLTGGKNRGEIGTIIDIIRNRAKYKLLNGEIKETIKNYIFVIGKQDALRVTE